MSEPFIVRIFWQGTNKGSKLTEAHPGRSSYPHSCADSIYSEQEGDKVSLSGEGSRRDSTASGTSAPLDDQMSGLRVGGGLQPPHSFGSPSSFGGPPASASPSDMPPTTPNMPHTPYAPGGSPGHGPAMSPPGGDHYGPSSGAGARYSIYSDRLPIISQPGSMSPSPVPRTVPLFVTSETQSSTTGSLHTSLDQPPELIPPTECSPWTSASESNYSTPPPADMSRPRGYWQNQHRPHSSLDWQQNADMLSPFSTQPEIHGTGSLDTVTTSHFGTTPFAMPSHMAPAPYQTYGPLLDPSLMAAFPDDQTQQSLLDTSMASQYIAHNRSSSVRSPSHPQSPALAADALVAPAALPSRAAPMAHVSRQKEMAMGGGNLMGAVGIYGDSGSPSWQSNNSGDILTGSALAGVGGCGSGGMTVVIPLPRSTRNSIPSYLDVYWDKFNVLYPFIHRGTVGGVGEDALRCAMAAIATQFLDNKDDRIRGNQLHEFASQEAKRVSVPTTNLSS